MTLTPLPAPPAEALHLLPPASLMALLAAAAAMLLVLAFLVLRRLFPRREPAATEVPPPPRTPATAPQPAVGLAGRIRSLEEKILGSKAFRDGCHHLARLIKSHLGQSTDLDAERMTSLEIDRAFDASRSDRSFRVDPRLGDFLTGLSRRRYGRDEPRRRDFVAACNTARELFVPEKPMPTKTVPTRGPNP